MFPQWTQNDITINGARLHYTRTGDGSHPPLVLVHGFSDNGLCWTPTARDLESEYDVLMPDARGHGLSARVQPGDAVDMAADLAGIIRDLGLTRPVIAGHSMGARTIAQLGARFPDVPRALILEDPPWWLPNPAAEPAQRHNPLQAWIKSLADLSLEEIIAQNRVEHPTWADDVLRAWCAAKKQLDQNFFAARDAGQMEWQDVVKALACPTLVITADPDKGGLITPEVASLITEMNPAITVAHIPGTGHHVRFEDYDAYMDVFRGFLSKIAT